MFRTKYKKRAGLMLYEMILSVFIITVCSGFIIQLFLYSKTVNAKANDIDNSSVILLNAMELSKNFPTLNKYYKDEFFDGSIITQTPELEGSNIIKFYDENWNTIYNITDKNQLNSSVKYIMELNVNEVLSNTKTAVLTFTKNDKNKSTYGNSSGLKYKIDGKVYYASDHSDVLIELQTTSYFGNNIK